tara:strand:- start:543 stop:935 length:393 start_codon:yes stop_codon:yes gene_type:complete
MKINKLQLKKIIREEIQKAQLKQAVGEVLQEGWFKNLLFKMKSKRHDKAIKKKAGKKVANENFIKGVLENEMKDLVEEYAKLENSKQRTEFFNNEIMPTILSDFDQHRPHRDVLLKNDEIRNILNKIAMG